VKYAGLIATTAMTAAASEITADGEPHPPEDHELLHDFAEALPLRASGNRLEP
jgi:hypothetical protein